MIDKLDSSTSEKIYKNYFVRMPLDNTYNTVIFVSYEH